MSYIEYMDPLCLGLNLPGTVRALRLQGSDGSPSPGRQLKVRRFGVVSPTDAKVDLKAVQSQTLHGSVDFEVLETARARNQGRTML